MRFKNWVYYAATKGQDVRVEVMLNTAGHDKKTRRNIICVHLMPTVSTRASEEVFKYLNVRETMAEQTEGNINALIAMAEEYVVEIEKQFNLTLLRGKEAWLDRIEVFSVDKLEAKRSFLNEVRY